MYAQVDTSKGIQSATLLQSAPVVLPPNLIGLGQGDLNNFEGLGGIVGVGYWPVTSIVNPSVAGSTTPDGTGVLTIDTGTMTATWTLNARSLNSTELAAYAAAQQALAKAAVTAIFARGIIVTSTGTSALNGTWGFTQDDQIAIVGMQTAVLSNVEVSEPYIDSMGGSHQFASNAQITALATWGMQYYHAVVAYVIGGAQGSPPSNAVTIP
jgi:hypothetical protein